MQDRLRADAERIRDLVAEGGRNLVCGGREMAHGVRETLAEILAPAGVSPAGFSPAALKARGRYAEDSY